MKILLLFWGLAKGANPLPPKVPAGSWTRGAASKEKIMSKLQGLPEITLAFPKFGSMSFGGPVSHLSYLREEFVAKRHWLTDDAYADLVALCQFLPGPDSSRSCLRCTPLSGPDNF